VSPASTPIAGPGEIILERASRSFSVRADNARTLKGLLIGRRVPGPPPTPALREVSLHVGRGETVGLVGRNGAGKSSTLKVLAGIIPLQSGSAVCGGRVVSLLELGAGFGRDFSGRENIYLNSALYGLRRHEIEERLADIIAFSELGEFIDVPVRTYSSGMYVRLGFAIAAHLDADVMLIDEVLAVGDESFQRKCLRRISEQIARGTTLVLVSHDAASIERVCERVVVLEHGQVVFDGPTVDGLLFYHRQMGTGDGEPESVRRPAGHAVEVVALSLKDIESRPAKLFRSGERLRAALTLRAPGGGVADVAVRLEVRDENGRAVFRAREALGQVRGEVELSFEIARLALLGGDYDVAVRAFDSAEQDDLDRADRLAGFSVAAEPGGEGIADLRGKWQIGERVGVSP
jgi:ABC-type polysaccharide/polyol phosphate transport system ATPase subunit